MECSGFVIGICCLTNGRSRLHSVFTVAMPAVIENYNAANHRNANALFFITAQEVFCPLIKQHLVVLRVMLST
ncbi:MAG: hypothetical protein AAF404_08410, partial [Pseudomonadota bacterium]